MRLTVLLTAALLGATGLSVPTMALESGDSAAAMRIYATSTEMNWFGVGAAAASVNLCVVSSTGRFRLAVTSARGGSLTGPNNLPYFITFRDGAGAETTLSTENKTVLNFEGNARPATDCSAGPNAQLRVRIPEDELTRGVAGSYFDELQFAVAPL